MAYLSDVAWCTDASERHSKTKHEAASQKHPSVDRRSLNTSPDDDDNCTSEHAGATSKVIIDRTAEQNGWDASNIIDRERDTSAAASRLPVDVSIGNPKMLLRTGVLTCRNI